MARQVVDFFRRFYRRVTSFSSHLGSLSSHQVDDEDGLISQSREWLKMKTELKIRQCTDLEQFYQVVSEAFEQLFPEVQYTCVFINDDGLKDSHGILFPDDVFANKLIGHRELVQNSSLAEGDKIYQLLVGTVSADILNTNGVSYLPIFTSGTRPTLSTAVLFVSQEIELDAENKERIELLKSSISHVRMSMLSRHHASTVSLIADMCTIGNNIAEGQMAVVLHLKRETQASSGFLLAFSQFDDDFVLKAVDNKLIPEKRFPCQSLPTFQSRLGQVKPSINSYTGAIKKDIVAVGGRLPASQCIIAPVKQNTQIIAFVVLLSQTESFTEKHLEVVDANLSLTGSLLYKDMAVERERTLRHQTEKLHQVAKNIFTHLGDTFGCLLKEKYQRLSDLCTLAESPSSLYATHNYSHFQNIFIPPINVQRLLSLDDRLIVIGPNSQRYKCSIEYAVEMNRSKDTHLSSIIDFHDLEGSGIEFSGGREDIESDVSVTLHRDKWDLMAGNLGYITEEVETPQQVSVQDTVITTDSPPSTGSHARNINPGSNEMLVESDDVNNNADEETAPKKTRQQSGTQSWLLVSRTSGVQPGLTSVLPENNIISQILDSAGPSSLPAHRTRGSSVPLLSNRTTGLGRTMSTAAVTRKVNVQSSKPKVVTKPSVINVAPAAAPVKYISDVPAHLADSTTALKDIKKSAENINAEHVSLLRAKTSSTLTLREVDHEESETGNANIRKTSKTISNYKAVSTGIQSSVLEESQPPASESVELKAQESSFGQSTVLSLSRSDHTSSLGSRNDSEESVNLKTLQATLRQDFFVPGKNMLDRDKTILHSMLGYKRRSVLEESTRIERLESGGSDGKSRNENTDNAEARLSSKPLKMSKSLFTDLKNGEDERKGSMQKSGNIASGAMDRKLTSMSSDQLAGYHGNNKVGRYGSLLSIVDGSAMTLRTKGVMDQGLVRRSVVNIDPRIHENQDNRFAVADRFERAKSHDHPLATSIQENKVLLMTVAAADGGAGPLRRKPSKVESFAKLKPFGMDGKHTDYMYNSSHRTSTALSRQHLRIDDLWHHRSTDLSKFDVGVQVCLPCEHHIDLETLMPPIRASYDASSHMRLRFRGVSGEGSYCQIQIPVPSSSTGERNKSSSWTHLSPPKTISPAVDNLSPSSQHLSGTTAPSATAAINTSSTARKHASSPQSRHESDIESLLQLRTHHDHMARVKARKEKAGDQTYEVEIYEMGTGDSQQTAWRTTTIQLCKYAPDSHCFTSDIENDLTILLKEIMQEARNLCHAEKCSVFLLENDETELVAKVFDGDIASHEEVRISATEGVAGHVVQTGKILNIKDAYSHPLFYRGVDESTGFRTRCILCFPIKDEKDVIIGAAQLCNKTTGPHFDSTDEVIAKALATYCCISIVNSLMYKDVLDAHNRVKLANELMIFHMHVPPHEVVDLINKPLLPLSTLGDNLHLHEFERSLPRSVEAPAMPSAVISMLHELEFTKTFRIKSNTLARFVLMVRKGYRDPPYHNWSHAFSVAHFAYLLLKNLNCISDNILNELEALAFFVASLCHDIDHRGTSNSFQVASNSVLAALYSSEGSVMERHHFSQTLCLLNTEGCNIFESVSRKEYQQLLDLIRDIILSTDIAHHLRIRGGLEGMAECGFEKTNSEHKSLLLCLFMTSADLADQTKPWAAAKRVSKMLYKEFFSQGDLEKALGRNPVEMMDRERASIPDLQIGFIDHIVLPAFSTLCTIFPTTECLVNNIRANRDHWFTIKNKTADRRDSLTSLDVFDFIDEEDERTSSGEEAANDSQ